MTDSKIENPVGACTRAAYDTSVDPYAPGLNNMQGVNSRRQRGQESNTNRGVRGATVSEYDRPLDNPGRYDNDNSVEPYANEARRSA